MPLLSGLKVYSYLASKTEKFQEPRLTVTHHTKHETLTTMVVDQLAQQILLTAYHLSLGSSAAQGHL